MNFPPSRISSAALTKNLVSHIPANTPHSFDLLEVFSPSTDEELSLKMMGFINETKIVDGHCMACAFNTCMAFLGYGIKEAHAPGSGLFQEFGDRFFKTHVNEIYNNPLQLEPNDDTYGTYKQKVADAIISITDPKEPVMVSIAEGTHWFAAYNDGEKIWFVDAQTGQGFNLHDVGKKLTEEVESANSVEILKISPDYYRKESTSSWWKKSKEYGSFERRHPERIVGQIKR